MSRHIQTRKFMYQATPNPKLYLMKSSMKRSTWFFGFKHGNFKNPLKIELHFGVTTKDTCLIFHIHVLNLFKSWSNLGFDQDSNGHKNSKKKQ
jgi:hypothetical protein